MDDLERFWSNILSEDTTLIGEAWATLSAGEREAIAGHLRSIVADSDRLPGQRHAASTALSVVRGKAAPTILLASGSPRRRELIALLGLPYETTPANVDETPRSGEEATSMVVRLSRAKVDSARATIRLFDRPTTRPILLAADTTVSLDGEILAKPADAVEARSMLTRLRGRSHHVYTAITLIDLETGEQITDLATTEVPMRDYSDAEVEAYIATGDSLDKAGGYAIQHGGFNPVAKMNGCYANVVGLPLCHVARSLRALGVEPPTDVPAACQTHLKYECPVFEQILFGQVMNDESLRRS
jgi:MAF protein